MKIDYIITVATCLLLLQHIHSVQRRERQSLCGYIKSLICRVNRQRVSLPLWFCGSSPIWVMAAMGLLVNVFVVTSNSLLPKPKCVCVCVHVFCV